MKIEKLNDKQIRCTLTKADLADRQLKLSELAYGTDKAKALFRDMVQQASLKFGFEAEDIPLMIEAVPLNSDCIVLIITKVEDPEELDTRFSRFSPAVMDEEDDDDDSADVLDHAPDSTSALSSEIADLFKRIKQEAANIVGGGISDVSVSITEEKPDGTVAKASNKSEKPEIISKIFSFTTLYEIIKPASAVCKIYNGASTLYKDGVSGRYMLVVTLSGDTKEAFNKACNVLSEYGKLERLTSVSESYFSEHFEAVIADNALQKLAQI